MDLRLPTWLIILLLFTLILICLYNILKRPNDYFSSRNIPFNKPLPLLGNMGPFLFGQTTFNDTMNDIYKSFEGSGVSGFYEFTTPVYVIRDPELYRAIVVKDFEYFTDHRWRITEEGDPIFGRTLFLLRGQRWRDMRHTLSPAFTSSKMKAMFLLVAECGQQLADYLEKKCEESDDGLLTLEMKDLFKRYANDAITTSAFGVHCNSLDNPNNEFLKVGNDFTNMGGRNGMVLMGYMFCAELMKFLSIPFISKYTATFFRTLIRSSIETREREGIIRPDMVHLLRQAQKGTLKKETTGDNLEGHENLKGKTLNLTDDDVTAQALIFFFGSFDASSTLLSFLTHQLALHPEIQQRLQREVDEVLEQDGGQITYDGVQRMKYMDMVISETLRLHPPGTMTDRVCVKPYTVPATATTPELKFNAGDELIYPVIGVHMDPKYWPEPMKFDPERFNDKNKRNIVPCTYLPFGEGPRSCIGNRFALMEAKIAIASLCSRFDIEVVSKTASPLRLKKVTFNLNAAGGFWLGIKQRIKQ